MHTAASQKQKLVIHMDNSPIHKPKVAIQKIVSMRVKLAPHPPYSPNLAPSDFFLVGYIKQKIAGHEFVSPDDLLEAIREEFERLSKSFLESLFDEWLIRLQTYLDYQGSYFLEG
jgi:histone-lysine N-methyltransferase SETMAR